MINEHLSDGLSCRVQRGFSLIEILIALMITTVALMALGVFSVAMMDSGGLSRERLTAVHLAEQVIESWQIDASDFRPLLSSTCVIGVGTSATSPASQTCKPGAQLLFTVAMTTTQAQAPLPTSPNNAVSSDPKYNPGTFSIRNMINTTPATPLPYVKAVTVSWAHKGGPTHSIFLTSLTRVQ